MQFKKCWFTLIFAFSLFITSSSTLMAKRLALVIGNDDYVNVSRLHKAVNDSQAVADTLKDIGFEVIHVENLKNRIMNRAIYSEFLSKIQKGDEALFYFAGHAIEIKNRNYLLAIDIPSVKPGNSHYLTKEAFAVDEIMAAMEDRGSRVNIMILDACRNNPFPNDVARSLDSSRGLAKIEPPKGSFVMFSAGTRQTALDRLSNDDSNPNSVYTRKLLPLLKAPGISLTKMAKKLRKEVEQLASTVDHNQYPAYYDQLRGEFFFTPSENNKSQSEIIFKDDLWESIKQSNNISDFVFYLKEKPKGRHSSIAKLRIQQLKAEQAPKTKVEIKPTFSQDQILWESIKNSNKASDYEFYLSKFPNGKYTSVAELKVRQLKEKQVAVPNRNILRSPPERPQVSNCDRLWIARNQIWKNHKYCFNTPKAQRYFGNEGCFRNIKQANKIMSKRNKSRVKAILRKEKRLGCL